MNKAQTDYIQSLENVIGEMQHVISAFYDDTSEVKLHDIPVRMSDSLRRNGFWTPMGVTVDEVRADYIQSIENVIAEMQHMISAFYSDAPEVELHDVPVRMAESLRRGGFWASWKAPFSGYDYPAELDSESNEGYNEAE